MSDEVQKRTYLPSDFRVYALMGLFTLLSIPVTYYLPAIYGIPDEFWIVGALVTSALCFVSSAWEYRDDLREIREVTDGV